MDYLLYLFKPKLHVFIKSHFGLLFESYLIIFWHYLIQTFFKNYLFGCLFYTEVCLSIHLNYLITVTFLFDYLFYLHTCIFYLLLFIQTFHTLLALAHGPQFENPRIK